MEGKISKRSDDDVKLLVDRVFPMDEARSQYSREVHLKMDPSKVSPSQIDKLNVMIKRFAGGCGFFFHLLELWWFLFHFGPSYHFFPLFFSQYILFVKGVGSKFLHVVFAIAICHLSLELPSFSQRCLKRFLVLILLRIDRIRIKFNVLLFLCFFCAIDCWGLFDSNFHIINWNWCCPSRLWRRTSAHVSH